MRRPLYKSRLWRIRVSDRRSLLIVVDLIVAVTALILSLYFWADSEKFLGFSSSFIQRRVPPWFFTFPLAWIILLVDLYDVHKAGKWQATIQGIARAALIGFGLYLALYFYYADPPRSLLPRRGVASFLIIVSLLTLLWRAVYIRIFTAPQFMRRVLIVGGGKAGRALVQVINELWPPPFFLVGIVDDDPQKQGLEIEGFKVLGTRVALGDLLEAHEVTDIIVAISGELHSEMFHNLLVAQERGVEIIRMPKVYEQLLGRVPIRLLEGDWILRAFIDEQRTSSFYEMGKRLLDILGGFVGVLILVACTPLIAIMILIDDGLPIFYSQTRWGKGAQNYTIYKFRTMYRDAEADGMPRWAKEDDQRATRVGRLLRRTHLDELPQFLNVLRGEMSLVGPRAERPELVAHFEKHVPFYRARLLVKPGITGWAQINFGYASTIEETTTKLEYDLYYIKNRSMIMDLVILLRTPSMVLGLRGR